MYDLQLLNDDDANVCSSKYTKLEISLILWVIQHNKRDCHTNTTMERRVLCSTLRKVQLVCRCKRLLETDISKRDCMYVLNMFDTLDVVMVLEYKEDYS